MEFVEPAETAIAPFITFTGVNWLVEDPLVPFPTCPLLLYPHPQTSPFDFKVRL
ncbi:hypothetical protein D3C73_1620080 [compost metagenome]